MNDSAYWDLHAKGVRAVNGLRFLEAEEAFAEARVEAQEQGLCGLADRAFCNGVAARLELDQRADVQRELSEILGRSEDGKARQLAAYYLAVSQKTRGNLRPARLYGEMAVRLACEMGDLMGQASGLDLLGMLAMQEERPEQAAESFRRSLESSRRVGASPYILITASTLGYCLGLQERWNEGLSLLQESQQVLASTEVQLYVPAARLNLGFAFLEHGDFDQAVEQGRAVLDSLGERRDLAKHAHYLLGEAYAQQEHYGPAAEHFEILQKTWYPQHPDLLEVLLSFRTSRLLNWLSR
jgi:tetratricopeptide (TPR) repeat protein